VPFKSKKQETYLKINEPKIYKEWKERYGTFKSDTLDNKNEQSKYMAQDKTGYEIPTDDNGSFYMQVRGDKETIKKAFKDWKPKAYPYEKRITQDSLNITCENCGEENVHYQFYLPQKNSRYSKMRFVDGATYCKYDEGNCGANLCSDCADDNDCENCGAEMCSNCADESEYMDNQKICVPCRDADEMNAETYGAEYTVEITGFTDGEPKRITGTEQELKDELLYFHDPYDRMIDYRLDHIEDEDEAMRLLKEKWNKFTLKQICDNDDMLTLIETKEAPYAGLGSLFGFGQDTGLGSFTTSELTGSSAIHGDFDSASLNYSGHQAVFARAENEMKNVEFEDWAKQEMKTHGKDVSFKNWAKKEEKSHGNVELMDWAEHEEESHDERYGADMKTYEAYDDKISERQEYLIEKLGGNSNSDMTRSQASDLIKKLQGKKSGTWRAEGDICNDSACDTEGPHEHCEGCEVILTLYDDENYCMNCVERMDAEEPMVEEPDFIPDGDGRALGQQTSSINLSPLHAEGEEELCVDCKTYVSAYDVVNAKGGDVCLPCWSKRGGEIIEGVAYTQEEASRYGEPKNYRGAENKVLSKTNILIAGVVGIGLWKGKEILDRTMASLKRSAEEKRKGKACGSCNSQGSIRKPHTQVKNSEYSVDQVNPVEVQGQNDIHGAEGVTNPRHSPSSEPFGYPSKSLKMW